MPLCHPNNLLYSSIVSPNSPTTPRCSFSSNPAPLLNPNRYLSTLNSGNESAGGKVEMFYSTTVSFPDETAELMVLSKRHTHCIGQIQGILFVQTGIQKAGKEAEE